jgi:Mg-chelatase subunit ChlD
MTISITSDTDRDEIARRIGATVDPADLRTSDTRRKRLEQSSQRRTRVWGLSLEIDESHPTAHVEPGRDDPHVVVTGRKLDQHVTDLDPEDWDYAAQRGLGWHEDGHVLFTDHEDFETRLRNLSTGDKGTAKQLWNALEDGAIETALAEKWTNAYDVLRILRANLFAVHEAGIQDVEQGGRVFPLAHATQATILDEWMHEVYDLGRKTKSTLADADDNEFHFATEDDRAVFMDEILPEIEAVVPDVLSEPNAVARNQRIFDFIEAVLPLISKGKADGKSQMNRDESQTAEGMPDDAAEGHSGEARMDADELDDIDPEDIDKVVIGDSSPAADPVDVELPDDVEVEIAEDVSGQKRQEAGVGDDLLDEVDKLKKALDTGPGTLASDEILLPDERWDANETVYRRARQGSKPLAQLLRNRLQQERHSEVKRHQRRGRFTGRGGATRRAQQGATDVKERVIEPDEKDYDFAFVIDRSGSMRSSMTEAEEAMIMLALALEAVGVNVMIIEMYGNEARLAKPFGVPTAQQKARVAHGNVSGSTPLSPSVDLARERLNAEGENAYLVVVSDGAPDNTSAFEQAIRNCSMPTLGVNLTKRGDPAGMDDYDRAVAAQPGRDLQQVLGQLVQEVMFT